MAVASETSFAFTMKFPHSRETNSLAPLGERVGVRGCVATQGRQARLAAWKNLNPATVA
jgi:hypothetical protein